MRRVILPTLIASLVPRIPQTTKRGLLELAADLVAIALTPVVRPTDNEPLAAPTATQLEDNELVHPARKDENWTATSAAIKVPNVLAVHPPAVHEGPGANLGSHSFLRPSDLQDRAEARDFLTRLPEVAG